MRWATRWRWAAPSPGRSTRCCRAASARRRPTPSPPSAPRRRVLSLACHLAVRAHGVAGRRHWPGSPCWRSASARPARAFYLWDHAVKRGDIRALGALSYATPILSTALLIAVRTRRTDRRRCSLAALLVTVGAVLASRELWRALGRSCQAPSPAARARSPRSRRPAPRCSRPGSRCRASARPARRRAARRSAASRRGRSRCRGADAAMRMAIVAQRQLERRAGIVMPDLVGIDPVPVRALAGLEQEVDRGAGARGPSPGARNVSR